MTTPQTETRMDRGIALHRSRGHEIIEVEPGIYRVPSCSGGGFYRVDLDAETCECPDRAPACKHMFAVTIFAAKRRCRRASARPDRRHSQPRQERPEGTAPQPTNNTPSAPDTRTTGHRDESLRGVLVNPERLAETAEKLGLGV